MIFVIDACRNTPAARAPSYSYNVKPFTQTGFADRTYAILPYSELAYREDNKNGPQGEIIIFSTLPGHFALDSLSKTSNNSPFAQAFAGSIPRGNIYEVIGRLATSVYRLTNGYQTPRNEGFIHPVFYFKQPIEEQIRNDFLKIKESSLDIQEKIRLLDRFFAKHKDVEHIYIHWAKDYKDKLSLQNTSVSTLAQTTASSATSPESNIQADISIHSNPKMILIPEGSFQMGCVNEDRECSASEKPKHQVYLEDYYIDQSEVTVSAYKQCVEEGRCNNPNQIEGCNWQDKSKYNHPMNCVTWFEAQTYCQFKGKRLPTEAQWEKAARRDNDDIYPWGLKSPTEELAHFGKKETTAVTSKHKAAYGLFGMAGNISEWVANCYEDNAYQRRAKSKNAQDNIIRCASAQRIFRGGSFLDKPSHLRSSFRRWHKSTDWNKTLGFRCAKIK